MKNGFWITVAAALVAARMAGGAGYAPEDLHTLDELVEKHDLSGLRAFVASQPDVLEIDDVLSRTLAEGLNPRAGFIDALNEEVARRGRGRTDRGRGQGNQSQNGNGKGKGNGGPSIY